MTFFVAFVCGLSTTIRHKKAFDWADQLFNQLTKNSAYYIPVATQKAASYKGVPMDLSVNPRWAGAAEKTARIIRTNGLQAEVIGDGRVRIIGDFGEMSQFALVDADLLFKGGRESYRQGMD